MPTPRLLHLTTNVNSSPTVTILQIFLICHITKNLSWINHQELLPLRIRKHKVVVYVLAFFSWSDFGVVLILLWGRFRGCRAVAPLEKAGGAPTYFLMLSTSISSRDFFALFLVIATNHYCWLWPCTCYIYYIQNLVLVQL